jgi:phenylpropionate dioxygenase-like ring-hydroxylating dioxygenase large terminal subunit
MGIVVSDENFAHPEKVVQSWYIALRSKQLRKERATSVSLLHRRIVFFRDSQGIVHALDAACPHLGADLGNGTVHQDQLRCAYHHWCYDGEGVCRSAPSFDTAPARRTRSYPVYEAWGFIWIFNGPKALFEGPWEMVGKGARVWLVHAGKLPAHPHIAVMNGMDSYHFSALHPVTETRQPETIQSDEYRTTLKLYGRPAGRLLRALMPSPTGEICGEFTAIGGNITIARVTYPHVFQTLFIADPSGPTHSRAFTFVTLPKGETFRPFFSIRFALGVILFVLPDDHRIFNNLEFHPGFSEKDKCLKSFYDQVNALPTW